MPKTVTITLREPIVGHRGTITEIVLRAPNLTQYAAIGEPVTAVPGESGKLVYIENDQAIAGYMEACMVEPKDKLLLDQVQLADAMNIRDAVVDFFVEARRESRSPTSPTSSSSTSS